MSDSRPRTSPAAFFLEPDGIEAAIRIRPLPMIAPSILDMVHAVTGLESTYIAEVDGGRTAQTVRFSSNLGALDIANGTMTAWWDSLCRRALDTGTWATDDVERDLPGTAVAGELGINAFVSVPIVDDDRRLVATLCGASHDHQRVASSARPVLLVLAQLIAEHWNRDRTHRAAMDHLGDLEQLARDHDVGLAEAEHQLKSPLAIITGWAETLLEDADVRDRPRLQRGLTSIQEASKRAVGQLDSLLEEARDRSLSASLRPEPLDLSRLSERIADDLQGLCGPDHRIAREITPDLWVHADPEAARQALWHLAENAVKYSPDGGVITIALSRRPETQEIVFVISDHGVGLPGGSDQEDLFTAFVRGSNTSGIEGTGLGLHIVRRLVQAMDGQVTATVGREQGAEFVITLPEHGVG